MAIEGIVGLANLNDTIQDNIKDIWADTQIVKKQTAIALEEKADSIRSETKWNGIFGAIGSAASAIGGIFGL